MGIYKNIQKRCKEVGTTVNALERDLGYGRGSISKWDIHVPGVDKVLAVAERLQTTVEELSRNGD